MLAEPLRPIPQGRTLPLMSFQRCRSPFCCTADPATLLACREPLLVLNHYLVAMGSPALVDAVVFQVQEPLARLEHAIRAVQVCRGSYRNRCP